jgi:hypothetical protein
VVQITDDAGNVTTAAAANPLTVGAPSIDLGVAFKNFVAVGRAGTAVVEPLTISDLGSAAAIGPLSIVIDASPTGELAGATMVKSLIRQVDIKPEESITVPVTLRESIPGSAFLIAQIDVAGEFRDLNLANNVVVSPTELVIK